MWLENQFPEYPDPTPDDVPPKVVIQTLGRAYGKQMALVTQQLGTTMHGVFEALNKSFSNPVAKNNKQSTATSQLIPQRPPHSMTPTRTFDRRGRKLY